MEIEQKSPIPKPTIINRHFHSMIAVAPVVWCWPKFHVHGRCFPRYFPRGKDSFISCKWNKAIKLHLLNNGSARCIWNSSPGRMITLGGIYFNSTGWLILTPSCGPGWFHSPQLSRSKKSGLMKLNHRIFGSIIEVKSLYPSGGTKYSSCPDRAVQMKIFYFFFQRKMLWSV